MEGKRGKGRAPKSFLWPLVIIINLFLLVWLIFSLHRFLGLMPEVSYKPLVQRAVLLEAADLDGDGADEAATVYPEEPYPQNRVLSVFSPFVTSSVTKFKYLFERLVLAGGTMMATVGYGPEKKNHLVVLTQSGQDLSVSIIGKEGTILKNTSINSLFQPGQQIATSMMFHDLNRDGYLDLVCALESAWTGLPRGVMALDIHKGRLLWKFLMGASVMDLRLLDVDADGQQEIIVSARSPHNGVSVNGLDDDHSYLICLDLMGKPRWIQQIGWYFTRPFIDAADLDGDGRTELVMAKTCDRVDRPEPGELRIIDPATGETRLRYTRENTSYSMVYIVRDPERKKALVVVGNDLGEISLFDEKLQLQKSIQLEKPAVIHGVFGLGKGSGKYLYVQAGFSRFYLLDLNLRRQHRFEFSEPMNVENIILKPLKNGEEWAGLLSADRLYLISRKPVFALAQLKRGMGLMLVAMVVHIFLFNTLVFLLARRRALILSADERKQNQWLELAQEVAHWMKNPMFTIGLQSERIKYLTAKIAPGELKENLTGAAAAILEDVSRLNEQIKIFMKLVAQRPMKFEAVDINALLRRLVERYREVAGEGVEFRLNLDAEKAVIRGDEEQLNEAFTNIISNALEAIEEKAEREKAGGEKGARAVERTEGAGERERAGMGGERGGRLPVEGESAGQDEARTAETAGAAPEQTGCGAETKEMKGMKAEGGYGGGTEVYGWIRISTIVVYSPVWRRRKGVLVEIEDNGPGMDEETMSRIFQPYFTTKESGMGIGLTLSRKIVEAHGGRIDVYSRPGVGTRFAVFLPG